MSPKAKRDGILSALRDPKMSLSTYKDKDTQL